MHLNHVKPYLSIAKFASIELPDFTLVTGRNGSGKSHLLEAISQGAINANTLTGGPIEISEIRIFNWSSFVPQDSGNYSSYSDSSEREQIAISVNNAITNNALFQNAYELIKPYDLKDLSLQEHRNPYKLLRREKSFWTEQGLDEKQIKVLVERLNFLADHADSNLLHHIYEQARDHITYISSKKGCRLIEVEEKDIRSTSFPLWGRVNLFENAIAKLFVAYRDTFVKNEFAALRKNRGELVDYLSSAEFEAAYGSPPWELLNAAISDANLDFSINHPDLYTYDSYIPLLKKNSTKAEINFSALSSGEKILLSFAFCIYYSQDNRQFVKPPKLVLLDEIDATLHPSMSKNVIDIIIKNLIGKFGLKVILATHSPSTVALAPDGSIYSMNSSDGGLLKTSKSAALDLLTAGVPTLSLSFDGRRQIFVENTTDAKIYSLIYELMKPMLASERSLEFVASGLRYGNSDTNMGCEVVRNIVSQLEQKGNSSVFGLIDYDGKNKNSSRVLVISEGNRDGIENLIYDPLLLALLVFRKYQDKKDLFGFSKEVSYLSLGNAGLGELQDACDKITFKIFDGAPVGRREAHYVGDVTNGSFSLQIDERCFSMDDHDLSKLIEEKFVLMWDLIKSKPAGNLMLHIVENILADHPKFIPLDFKKSMSELLIKNI
jgi:predicted ATPase